MSYRFEFSFLALSQLRHVQRLNSPLYGLLSSSLYSLFSFPSPLEVSGCVSLVRFPAHFSIPVNESYNILFRFSSGFLLIRSCLYPSDLVAKNSLFPVSEPFSLQYRYSSGVLEITSDWFISNYKAAGSLREMSSCTGIPQDVLNVYHYLLGVDLNALRRNLPPIDENLLRQAVLEDSSPSSLTRRFNRSYSSILAALRRYNISLPNKSKYKYVPQEFKESFSPWLDLYSRFGSWQFVAAELGLSYATVRRYVKKFMSEDPFS